MHRKLINKKRLNWEKKNSCGYSSPQREERWKLFMTITQGYLFALAHHPFRENVPLCSSCQMWIRPLYILYGMFHFNRSILSPALRLPSLQLLTVRMRDLVVLVFWCTFQINLYLIGGHGVAFVCSKPFLNLSGEIFTTSYLLLNF